MTAVVKSDAAVGPKAEDKPPASQLDATKADTVKASMPEVKADIIKTELTDQKDMSIKDPGTTLTPEAAVAIFVARLIFANFQCT